MGGEGGWKGGGWKGGEGGVKGEGEGQGSEGGGQGVGRGQGSDVEGLHRYTHPHLLGGEEL